MTKPFYKGLAVGLTFGIVVTILFQQGCDHKPPPDALQEVDQMERRRVGAIARHELHQRIIRDVIENRQSLDDAAAEFRKSCLAADPEILSAICDSYHSDDEIEACRRAVTHGIWSMLSEEPDRRVVVLKKLGRWPVIKPDEGGRASQE